MILPPRPPGPRALVLFGALCLATACDDGAERQRLTGRLSTADFTSPVVGVRAVAGGEAVAWSALDRDGRFALDLSPGAGYRLEVVTTTGAHAFIEHGGRGLQQVAFDVCQPTDAFEIGQVAPLGGGSSEPADDAGAEEPCGPDGGCTGPAPCLVCPPGFPDCNADPTCDDTPIDDCPDSPGNGCVIGPDGTTTCDGDCWVDENGVINCLPSGGDGGCEVLPDGTMVCSGGGMGSGGGGTDCAVGPDGTIVCPGGGANPGGSGCTIGPDGSTSCSGESGTCEIHPDGSVSCTGGGGTCEITPDGSVSCWPGGGCVTAPDGSIYCPPGGGECPPASCIVGPDNELYCIEPPPCDPLPPVCECPYTDPLCWPIPDPCGGAGTGNGPVGWMSGVVPQNAVPSFGCDGSGSAPADDTGDAPTEGDNPACGGGDGPGQPGQGNDAPVGGGAGDGDPGQPGQGGDAPAGGVEG